MSEPFNIDLKDPTPIYAQLERAIRFAIATGRLNIGEQLPTVRQLAVDLRINANTVAKVYAELERTGVVETRRGVGTFVRSMHPFLAACRNERERKLNALVEHFFAEATALGFSPQEVHDYLVSKLTKESETHV